MSLQMQRTAGLAGRKLRRRATDELEAKMPFLPQMEEQKLKKQTHADTMKLEKARLAQAEAHAQKSHKLKKKGLALEELTAEREMGIGALKFGANIALNSGGTTIGEMGTKLKSGFQKTFGGGGGQMQSQYSNAVKNVGQPKLPGLVSTQGQGGGVGGAGTSATTGGFFSGLQPGMMLGSGLAGFGASRLVKGKGKRMLLGAGVGGLMSLFGGGGGMTSLGSTILGGLGGLLG